MNDTYNTAPSLIMHVDLNSCFATVEQQSRPLLRDRPIAIVNRASEHTGIVTASYEAKALGVSVGMKFKEAARLAPGLIGVESDPAKYRFVYRKLLAIMNDYSAHVTMKSIDEGVIDFHQATQATKLRPLLDIGMEIKQRLRDEIGTVMRCNVGIAPNRFLAKTAAGLHKPDGIDSITADNLRTIFSQLKLTDLTGIASQNQARLQAVGIYTPLQFLDSDPVTLQKIVFKSITGLQWHQRLRGYEVDDRTSDVKRVGRQYVLERFDLTAVEIVQRLHHLCESVGERMRNQGKSARGVYVYAKSREQGMWHASHMAQLPFSSNQAIFATAERLFLAAPSDIKEIGIHCYELGQGNDKQLMLFGDELAREQSVTQVIDDVNGRYGERTMHAASTLGTGQYVRQKVPFGSTRYL